MAKTGRINFGGGGGIDPDELNALPEHVLTGKSFGGSGSDEPQTGSMPNRGAVTQALNAGGSYTIPNGYHNGSGKITANSLASQTSATATAGYIYSGKTAWVNGSKITGNMTVNSLLSFSVAANSGRRVLATWKNPTAASGKPYSGIYIRYSTSGYPGKTSGTQIYKGSGNNTSSGGTSTAYLTLPNLCTKYYLSAYPYVTCSVGELTGSAVNATVTTSNILNKTFTSSQNYTIPNGYNTMDIFCVGGGGSGIAQFDGGGGGGGGYTSTVKTIAVSSGQVLSVLVGSGGAQTQSNSGTSDKNYSGRPANAGGNSSITRSGVILCNASGCSDTSSGAAGCDGGSGGGAAGYYRVNCKSGGNGGSDGGSGSRSANGASSSYYYNPGKGQGTTTRAFGLSSGTLYASGGGGGASGKYNYDNQFPSSSYDEVNRPLDTRGGNGGPGGGRGGDSGFMTVSDSDEYPYSCLGTNGSAGSANTGGGGGGAGGYGGRYNYLYRAGGAGGSGVVLIKL